MNNIKLSVSKQCYKSKDAIKINELRFVRSFINITEFEKLIRDGYCFCHWFDTPQDEFSIIEKRKDNFDRANIIFVDVDDYDMEMKGFVNRLTMKPTVYYTTPSNGKNGRFRFRLCYLFKEDLRNEETFTAVYQGIIDSIRKDIPDYPDKDKCGGYVAQYMNGNGSSNCEVYSTDYCYCLKDFEVKVLASKAVKKTVVVKKENISRDYVFTDDEFKEDFLTMKPTELLTKYRDRYPFFCCSELIYNSDGYALIGEDYKEIYRTWCNDVYIDDAGREHKSAAVKKRRDGDRRRYYIYISALIRKQIKPDITFEHLLFNLVCERHWYYDNSDKVLSNEFLMEKAKNVIDMPVKSITIKSKRKRPQFKVDKEYCRQNNIKPVSLSNHIKGILNSEKISEMYDCNLSVAENLELLHSYGIKVGKTKLYDFCHANGIPTNPKNEKIEVRQIPTYFSIQTNMCV